MAIERFANNASTTLAADITAGATSLTPTSGALFPTSGNFRILLGSELILVTAVGGSWTIVRGIEGTTAAAHSAGDTITHVVTAQSLRSLSLFGYSLVPPDNAGFSWVNQGTATVTVRGDGALVLRDSYHAGCSMSIRKKAAPATPYAITAAFSAGQVAKNFLRLGLCFRQSSDGKLHTMTLNGAGTFITRWSSPTTYFADYVNFSLAEVPRFWRIADDGANRICSVSWDGQEFVTLHSVGRTDFLTADEVGFLIDTQDAGVDNVLTLLSWEES